jgi:hypothetical protein
MSFRKAGVNWVRSAQGCHAARCCISTTERGDLALKVNEYLTEVLPGERHLALAAQSKAPTEQGLALAWLEGRTKLPGSGGAAVCGAQASPKALDRCAECAILRPEWEEGFRPLPVS